jgi:hypothetical protein
MRGMLEYHTTNQTLQCAYSRSIQKRIRILHFMFYYIRIGEYALNAGLHLELGCQDEYVLHSAYLFLQFKISKIIYIGDYGKQKYLGNENCI